MRALQNKTQMSRRENFVEIHLFEWRKDLVFVLFKDVLTV